MKKKKKEIQLAVPFEAKERSLNLLVRRVATAAQTGGEFAVVEMSGVKGTGASPHAHGAEAEAFFILDGTFHVRVGDIDVRAHPGDFVYIPKNAPHTFTIESEFGRMLCLITPGGFEDLFVTLGSPTSGAYPPNADAFPPVPFTPEEAAQAAERFHLRFQEDW